MEITGRLTLLRPSPPESRRTCRVAPALEASLSLHNYASLDSRIIMVMYYYKTRSPQTPQKSGNPLSRGTGTGTGGAGGGAAKSSPMVASDEADAATKATGPASGGGGTAP